MSLSNQLETNILNEDPQYYLGMGGIGKLNPTSNIQVAMASKGKDKLNIQADVHMLQCLEGLVDGSGENVTLMSDMQKGLANADTTRKVVRSLHVVSNNRRQQKREFPISTLPFTTFNYNKDLHEACKRWIDETTRRSVYNPGLNS
ncbi:hypothetical protein K1719_031188 [Acacia pycnantha]|nr:hypothetical protein K1719_031188 [Acacia pycnantha]